MRKLLIIIPTALQVLLWATGCGKDGRSPEALQLAEEIMNENPDSAYKLLRDINTGKLTARGDSALYHLLLTQAKYKCYEDITTDSMIDFCANYFEGTNDKHHAMLASYYSGTRYFDLKRPAESVGCYLEAEKLAKECDDRFYLGLIYESMVEVYKKTYDTPMALKYALLAKEALRATDKYVYEQDASIYIAESYLNAEQYEQSIREADSLISVLEKENNISSLNWVRRILGYALRESGRPAEAIEPLLAIMNSPESSGYVKDYRNLGLCYYMTGDTASAMEWFSKIDTARGDDYFIPWEVYADRGDYREAFNSIRAEYRDMDRRVSAILRDNVNRVVTEFGEERVMEATERVASERRQKVILAVALAAMLIAGTGGFAVYRRQKTAKLREVMTMIDELRPGIAGGQEETGMNGDTGEPMVLYRSRFEHIRRLCDSYFAAGNDERQRKRALNAVEKMLRNFRSDRGTLHELEVNFNRCTDNLMASFRRDFPDLPETDSLLMLLLFAGFSSSAICVILGVKMQTLYNRKSALRKTIEGSQSVLRDRYLSFCKRHGG